MERMTPEQNKGEKMVSPIQMTCQKCGKDYMASDSIDDFVNICPACEKKQKLTNWIEFDSEYANELKRIGQLKLVGHFHHCAYRQVWGDGECTCNQGILPRYVMPVIKEVGKKTIQLGLEDIRNHDVFDCIRYVAEDEMSGEVAREFVKDYWQELQKNGVV